MKVVKAGQIDLDGKVLVCTQLSGSFQPHSISFAIEELNHVNQSKIRLEEIGNIFDCKE